MLRDLEAEGERIPVLAMTAAAVEGEREKCLAAGMDDFLTKPVNPDALAAMLHDDEHLARTPLIMLTSSAEPTENELRHVGIVECLTKPVLAGDVLEALLRALGSGEPAARRTSPRSRETRIPVAEADRPRLLVVEDNPVNQLVALGILETLGYAADTADDGLEALEVWKRGSYAAVLMDVQMPRMDGYAATRALRELEEEHEHDRVPVIAMTAAAVEGEREKCLAAGMDDFLTKPVNPDALGAMLRRWLSGEHTPHAALPRQTTRRDGALDLERLDMLRDLDPGSTTYLDKAIGNFVARVPESVHAIRTAARSHDHEALTYSAHRLKGSALNLGLPAVGHLAYELEMLGDTGTTNGAAELVEDLEEALTRAVEEMLAYQRGYRDGSLRPSV